jgi:membrane-associated phospholipid phosphatase
MILAGVIALSRLYVGVHYPSDVLGGMVVGIFAGWAGWKLMQMLMLQMSISMQLQQKRTKFRIQ